MINQSIRTSLIQNYEKIHVDDYSELFNHVRRTLKTYLNRTRPGIMLGLIELGFDRGNFIGGLHYGGTNEIYLNKSALRVMKDESKPEMYKAYIYFVLLHEYIHSVGVHNERHTRNLTKDIILDLFGENHILGGLAIYGLAHYFPYTFNQRNYHPTQMELLNPEYVTLHHIENEFGYL